MLVNFNEILKEAKEKHYAVPHFNINNLEWTKYILEECNKLQVPVILGVSSSAAQYMGGWSVPVAFTKSLIEELNINIPVCGLVKDDKHQTRGIIYENEEIIINRNSNLMQLIRRIQDEVHRFAITYHRALRDKRTLHSILDDIPNVGQKRRMALLKHFGSVEKIKEASLEELLKIDSIDKKTADSIVSYFNSSKEK